MHLEEEYKTEARQNFVPSTNFKSKMFFYLLLILEITDFLFSNASCFFFLCTNYKQLCSYLNFWFLLVIMPLSTKLMCWSYIEYLLQISLKMFSVGID